ncbi:hypothetical protein ACFQ60_05360 [Streptomyces zhihengii]
MDDARAALAAALAEAAGGRAAALAEAGRRSRPRACLRAVPLDPGAADAIDDLLTRLRERTS